MQKHSFMPVHFSDREMTRAWKNNFQAYNLAQPKTNAHRLLLFYSVECGLKAAKMRRDKINSTLACPEIISKCGHDINKLLDILNVEKKLRIPQRIRMDSNRQVSVDEINQMWRYGGEAITDIRDHSLTDKELESCLIRVSKWIEQELRQ